MFSYGLFRLRQAKLHNWETSTLRVIILSTLNVNHTAIDKNCVEPVQVYSDVSWNAA